MKNQDIRCTVKQCKYNCGSEDYCNLDSIDVGYHSANPKTPEDADCNSFETK